MDTVTWYKLSFDTKLEDMDSSKYGKNIPVSFADLDLAEKIFKADFLTIKWKRTKPHPPIVTQNDIIELPDELQHNGWKLELAIDVVYINN